MLCEAFSLVSISARSQRSLQTAEIAKVKYAKKQEQKKDLNVGRLLTKHMIFRFMSRRTRRGYAYVASLVPRKEGCMAGQPADGVDRRRVVVQKLWRSCEPRPLTGSRRARPCL